MNDNNQSTGNANDGIAIMLSSFFYGKELHAKIFRVHSSYRRSRVTIGSPYIVFSIVSLVLWQKSLFTRGRLVEAILRYYFNLFSDIFQI